METSFLARRLDSRTSQHYLDAWQLDTFYREEQEREQKRAIRIVPIKNFLQIRVPSSNRENTSDIYD